MQRLTARKKHQSVEHVVLVLIELPNLGVSLPRLPLDLGILFVEHELVSDQEGNSVGTLSLDALRFLTGSIDECTDNARQIRNQAVVVQQDIIFECPECSYHELLRVGNAEPQQDVYGVCCVFAERIMHPYDCLFLDPLQ